MAVEISFLGLLISLGFITLTGIYPGGIIVPSYLVLFVNQPLRIAGTLTFAVFTFGVYRLASRFLILFGTRRLVFMILLGGVLTWLWIQIFPAFIQIPLGFRVIGWIIPGLIANQIERQGVGITLAALVTVSVFIHFAGRLLTLLGQSY